MPRTRGLPAPVCQWRLNSCALQVGGQILTKTWPWNAWFPLLGDWPLLTGLKSANKSLHFQQILGIYQDLQYLQLRTTCLESLKAWFVKLQSSSGFNKQLLLAVPYSKKVTAPFLDPPLPLDSRTGSVLTTAIVLGSGLFRYFKPKLTWYERQLISHGKSIFRL